MSKKSPTPKKARTPRTSTTTPEPIDHRAISLLAYIDDGATRVDAIEQARSILRNVAAELASGHSGDDVSVMHGGFGAWTGVFSTVFDAQVKRYQQMVDQKNFPDFRNELRFMKELEGDKKNDLTVTDPQVAFDVMVGCVTDAAVLGAALMYELMTGRTR